MQTLSRTGQVIDALGGTSKVAEIANRKPQAVSNWRARSTFPPGTFLILTEALREKGLNAPRSLWRMSPAPSDEMRRAG